MWARLSWLMVVPGLLAAQEPPSDPYAGEAALELAVDPTDHAGEDYVYLLQDGHLQVEEGGHTSYTVRHVVQILTGDGAGEFGEFSLPYDPSQERLTINWMRVYRDGQLVSDGPEYQRESLPTIDQSAPIYTDTRLLQATLAGVGPGAIVDVSTTVTTDEPYVPGDFWEVWYLNGTDYIVQTRFTVDQPASMEVHTRESGEGFERGTRTVGDRRITTWSADHQTPLELEPFAGFPNDVVKWVSVSGAGGWEQIGEEYRRFLPDEVVLSAELAAAHDAELAGATTLRDSLAATYRWVAQDFRYVSLSLGDGGYRPRPPQEVFETRFGDCKDKTMFFVALANRLGVTAWPLLAAIDGGVDPEIPTLRQFDHMVAAVELDDETIYLDLTSRSTPFGDLPPVLDAEHGLLVPDARAAELVSLPESDPAGNVWAVAVEGTLDMAVGFVGSVSISAEGSLEPGLREAFFDPDRQGSRERSDLIRQIATGVYTTAVVDSSAVFDGSDLEAEARVTIWFTAPRILGTADDQYLLYLPISNFANSALLDEIRSDEERVFPIDVELVNDPTLYRTSFDVGLPNGWATQLPEDVVVAGDFGSYAASYRSRNGRFSAVREMVGDRGLLPPERSDALVEWFEGLGEDNVTYVILDPEGRGTVASASGENSLATILPRPGDVGADAEIVREGSSGFLSSMEGLSQDPIDEYSRDFGSSQMLFQLGESPLLVLAVGVAEFRSAEEARRNQQMYELLDPGSLLSANLGVGGPQGTVGEPRELDLPSIDDAFRGWVVPLVSPLATFDLMYGTLVRDRFALTAVALGAAGLRDEDLDGLFSLMDERIQAHPAFASSVEPIEDPAPRDTPAGASDADGYDLESMVPGPSDFTGSKVAEDRSIPMGDISAFARRLEGRAFTFEVQDVDVIKATMRLEIFPTEAQALKWTMDARDEPRSVLYFQEIGGPAFQASVLGDETQFSALSPPELGTLSFAGVAELRGPLRVDLGYLVFTTGRLRATVNVMTPPGAFDVSALRSISDDVYQRIEEEAPDQIVEELDEELVENVTRVMELEERVNALLDDEEYEELLATIEGEYPEPGVLTFEVATWNNICWYGALNGYAEEVLRACEAALLPNPENLGRLDSRAVARALSGDIEGAIDDLAFIVTRVADGEFKDIRSAWLRSLRDGENPFTEEVIETLR